MNIEQDLDPGIRRTVMWLRERGFNTTDSGDGVSKVESLARGDALAEPHVFMTCDATTMKEEADRLRDVLSGHAKIDGCIIEANYSPFYGLAFVCLWGVNDALLFPESSP